MANNADHDETQRFVSHLGDLVNVFLYMFLFRMHSVRTF